MPIKIPDGLPARTILDEEGVPLIEEQTATRQDIRPLKIAVLNLMPEKEKTETQLARLLGSTPLQVEMTLLGLETHKPKNVSPQHMADFYSPWTALKNQKFDGLIITGAPIEQMPFEEVTYWPELCELFDWSVNNVHGQFNLCWGAQASLYYHYKIPKYDLPQKAFGVFEHQVIDSTNILMHGLNDEFKVPVSRHTENHAEDIAAFPHLKTLVQSEDVGLCLIHDQKLNHVNMFNHLEYDSHTLGDEYARDVEKGDAIQLPAHYFPADDPSRNPINRWRSNAHILYGNWVNLIYQTTPYDPALIGTDGQKA